MDFKTKNVARVKEYFIMIKGQDIKKIQQLQIRGFPDL